jgi:hypothetical protein
MLAALRGREPELSALVEDFPETPRRERRASRAGVRRAGPRRALQRLGRYEEAAAVREAIDVAPYSELGSQRAIAAKASRTPRSAPGCSSADTPSRITYARSSPSSASPPATKSTGSCPTPPAPSGWRDIATRNSAVDVARAKAWLAQSAVARTPARTAGTPAQRGGSARGDPRGARTRRRTHGTLPGTPPAY